MALKSGAMDVAESGGPGVTISEIHWEHYAQRVADIDMASLDEGNFLAGCASVFVSMIVALIGVGVGTTDPSAVLIAILVALLFGSGVGTYFYFRKYTQAKSRLKKTGATVCREMREIAKYQNDLRAAETALEAKP